MADGLTLIGFKHSVYTRIVRMALIEMRLTAAYVEANPFADAPDPTLALHTPLGRVPVLLHGGFTLTETAAILRYLDALSPGVSLVPEDPKAAAQMAQVIGIVDAYGYQPMVRDVFSHAVYRPRFNEEADPERVHTGLVNAVPALLALDRIAQQERVLTGQGPTLADLHLAPMMAYFTSAPEGAAQLEPFGDLQRWWDWAQTLPSLGATDPFAPA